MHDAVGLRRARSGFEDRGLVQGANQSSQPNLGAGRLDLVCDQLASNTTLVAVMEAADSGDSWLYTTPIRRFSVLGAGCIRAQGQMGSGTLVSAKSDGEPGTLVVLALNLTIRFQEGAEV